MLACPASLPGPARRARVRIELNKDSA